MSIHDSCSLVFPSHRFGMLRHPQVTFVILSPGFVELCHLIIISEISLLLLFESLNISLSLSHPISSWLDLMWSSTIQVPVRVHCIAPPGRQGRGRQSEMEECVYFKGSSPQEKSRENGKWLVEVVFSIIFYLIQDDCTSMYNKMMHRSK